MSTNEQWLMDLFKANLKLQNRLAQLTQDNSLQWLEFGQQLAQRDSSRSDSEAGQLLFGDWLKVAGQPVQDLWKQLSQAGADQNLARLAMMAQTAFASGLQDAFSTWQRETAQALAAAPGAASGAAQGQSPWPDLVRAWQALMPQAGDAPARGDADTAGADPWQSMFDAWRELIQATGRAGAEALRGGDSGQEKGKASGGKPRKSG